MLLIAEKGSGSEKGVHFFARLFVILFPSTSARLLSSSFSFTRYSVIDLGTDYMVR